MIGAGSVVLRDVPAGVLAVGAPARVVRPLKPAELEHLARSAANYVAYAQQYLAEGWTGR